MMDKEVAEIVEHHGTAAWWPAESVKPLLTKIEQLEGDNDALKETIATENHVGIAQHVRNVERIQQLEAVRDAAKDYFNHSTLEGGVRLKQALTAAEKSE